MTALAAAIDIHSGPVRGSSVHGWGAVARWGGALAIVLAAHAGGVWLALHWPRPAPMAGDPPPAVMIELSPLAVAPEAPPQEVAPGPQMTEAEPEPLPEPVQKPIEEPMPDIKVPELPPVPPVPQAAVTLPPPPKPKPRVERKPPPRPVERVEHRKPIEPDKPRRKQTTAPPTSSAQRASVAAAPTAGASDAPSMSPASWRSSLMAHLNRYKRPSAGAASGTAQVAFAIDRAGRVLSARLISSSGSGALDDEAVALVRRASPVPAPPSSVGGGGTVALTVPVRFTR